MASRYTSLPCHVPQGYTRFTRLLNCVKTQGSRYAAQPKILSSPSAAFSASSLIASAEAKLKLPVAVLPATIVKPPRQMLILGCQEGQLSPLAFPHPGLNLIHPRQNIALTSVGGAVGLELHVVTRAQFTAFPSFWVSGRRKP